MGLGGDGIESAKTRDRRQRPSRSGNRSDPWRTPRLV